jgi:NAD(P)-dependent dehydrogenase (short-subunit alcohol dehydrogenase family)
VSEMVKTAVRTFGRLDVAVNNAAISPDRKPLAEMDEDAFDTQLRVNLKSVALCLKYELAQILSQGSKGSIVNIASVSGIRPQPSNPGYMAAKHGVIGLTKSASLDYSCHGIRVNAVAPGAVDTPMLRRQLQLVGRDIEATGKRLSQLGRTAQAVEIAHASLWLASNASSYITGVTLPADGGYTAM